MEDLTGKQYHRLTVIEPYKKNGLRQQFWKCKCVCGNIKYYRSDYIKSGRRKSCGCIKSPGDEEYREKLKNRLLKFSKKINGCLQWIHRSNPQGYGLIKVRGKNHNASRAAWYAWNGDIPKGMYVLHKCDNRLCIDPSHLFLGTHHDNMKDMINKNRQNKRPGEKHHMTILKDEDILDIRMLWDQKFNTQTQISKKYNVSTACICNIVNRNTWKHLL